MSLKTDNILWGTTLDHILYSVKPCCTCTLHKWILRTANLLNLLPHGKYTSYLWGREWERLKFLRKSASTSPRQRLRKDQPSKGSLPLNCCDRRGSESVSGLGWSPAETFHTLTNTKQNYKNNFETDIFFVPQSMASTRHVVDTTEIGKRCR